MLEILAYIFGDILAYLFGDIIYRVLYRKLFLLPGHIMCWLIQRGDYDDDSFLVDFFGWSLWIMLVLGFVHFYE